MTIFEITIFGVKIAPTYYALMYVLGFVAGYIILKYRNIIPKKHLDDLLLYMFLGVILGGRFGFVLFYNFSYYLENPLDVLEIWEGGMSFHGGVIGVILAMWCFSKRFKFSFLKLADQITLIVPIGLFFGRIGNYLNKELLGFSPYNGFLAVYKNGIGYFPSPLLEAILEGLVLFLILNIMYICKTPPNLPLPRGGINQNSPLVKGGQRRVLKSGQIASLFLIFYSIFRIFVEICFRQPDANIGYILNYFTMGELLSIPMLVVGIYYYFKLKNA